MKAFAVALTILFFSVWSNAQNSDKNNQQLNNIKATINAALQTVNLTANEIYLSEVDGLVEVLTDRGLFYFTKDGKYLIQGKVFNITGGIENVTEKSLAKVRIAGIKQFEGSMIVFPAKQEKFKVTIFTDTSCGYCRKLHAEMQGYNDLGITVRYLAFPRSGTSGQTFKDLTAIWCAVDQQTAMTKAKSGDTSLQPQAQQCDMPIAGHYNLGQKLGVNGTPAIVLEDGQLIPGYQPPQQLFGLLQKNL